MKLRFSSAVSLILLPALASPAEDLLSAYAAARENDPRYRAAILNYEAETQAVPLARAALLPSLSFDARHSETEQNIIERDNALFGAVGESRYPTRSWSFQATQPVFEWASWVGLRQAKAQVRVATAVLEGEKQTLIRRTAETFLGVLAARDGERLASAELDAVARQLKLVRARRRGGLANINDEYEAQARFSRVQADVIAAQYNVDSALQELRQVVGDDISNPAPIRDAFPLVEPEPTSVRYWVDAALQQNFLLIAARESVDVARQETKRQRAGHYPSLNLVARHGNIDTGGAVTGGGSDVDTSELALQFTIPLYAGGGVRSRSRQASALYGVALEEREQQERSVVSQTRGAYHNLLSAISRIRALEDSVKFQSSGLTGREKGYRSGLNTLLDVLDAERELYATSRDLSAARYQYLLSWLLLREQIGALSESDLAYVNGFIQ